jgi:hypothetical protein
LKIGLEDTAKYFQELEFNVNATPDGFITLYATGNFGVRTQLFALDQSGQNFFSLQATGGDYFTQVRFVTDLSRIEEVDQVRVGGVDRLGLQGDLTPEGDGRALLAGGILPIALLAGRRRKRLLDL